ncbi:Protein quaking-B [Liparis tanakae]|uniref:Protein quaking-B n=1 Tax=Liparis tanakae TaxID=230148 RepID=A0A4Z2FU66_9TELE|nr:Protein quaking-B [Liparis tanakae]
MSSVVQSAVKRHRVCLKHVLDYSNIFPLHPIGSQFQVEQIKTYNFVGRILGPRGLTAKQLEAETGCKIMVRGKSSMRDKKKTRCVHAAAGSLTSDAAVGSTPPGIYE